MSVLKGLIQLDMLPNTYPSIIVSEGYSVQYYKDITYNTPQALRTLQLKTPYTNLFTYLMLYYPNFRGIIENVLDNPDTEQVITLFGYVPNSRLEIGFQYVGSRNLFQISKFYFYGADGSWKGNLSGFSFGFGSANQFKERMFTENSCEIYLHMYEPYDVNATTTNLTLITSYWTQANEKRYYTLPGDYTTIGINNSYEILSDYFHAPTPEPLPDTPVGAPSGNNTDISIDIPSLPSVSILDGLHHMYCPDSANVKKMGRALWSPNFFDNVVKVFANPSEAIVSLALSPIKPTVSENDYNIIVGNIELQTTTGVETSNVTAPILTSQYGTYSFGELPLYEKYSSYLDYNTTVQIYLPFIGIRELSVNDVMGKSLSLTYNVDFFTGDFIALLKCVDPFGALKSVLYHWNGNLLSHLPISASDFSNGILSGLTTSLSIAGGIATGGATGTLSAVGGSLGSLGGFKPTVDKGSSTNSNVGMLDNFNAYLIVTKPIEDKPEEYNFIKGGTVNKNIKLTQGLGFVVCGELHLESIGNATSEEKTEIESLLKSGVIL